MSTTQAPPLERIRISTPQLGPEVEDLVLAVLRSGHLAQGPMVERFEALCTVMAGTAQSGARYSFYLDATAYDEVWPFPKIWPAGARPRCHGGRAFRASVRRSVPGSDAGSR